MMNPQYPGNPGQPPPSGYGPPPGQMGGQRMPPPPQGQGQNMYNGPPPGQMYGGQPPTSTPPHSMYNGSSMGQPGMPGPPGNFGGPVPPKQRMDGPPIGGPGPTQNGPQIGSFPGPPGPQGDMQRGPSPMGPGKPPQMGQFQRPPHSAPNAMVGQTATPTSASQLSNQMGAMNLSGPMSRSPQPGMGPPPPGSSGPGNFGPPSNSGPGSFVPSGSSHIPNSMAGPPPTSQMQPPSTYGGNPNMSGPPQPPSMSRGYPSQTPPPTSQMGGMPPPPTNQMVGMPPPPTSQMGGMPPQATSQVGGMPPPPTNQMGGMPHPPTSQMGGMPPPPNQMGGGMPPPPNQMGGGMPPPPTSQMGGMPPMSNAPSSQFPPGPGGQFPSSQGNVGQFPPPQGGSGQFMGGALPGQGFPQQPFQGGGGGQRMAGPSSMQQPAPRKLDPDQMPSPIQVIEDDIRNRSGVFSTATKGAVPPLVTTKFVVQDQGNCSPRFMRSTMYNIPCTSDMLKNCHIPFALTISPFGKIHDQEIPPPVVNLGELGPVRCKRCKAYMSPHMMFIDGGRRFQCVYCGAATDVPAEYFAHLDHTGRRVDCYDRPELCLGSYELVATKDYCKNGVLPKAPAFIFMIDVSYNSVKSGLVNLICDRLKDDILVNLPKETGMEESEIRVGFVTYAKEIHFYNVKGNLAQPQMLVVSDLEDVFVPLLDGFLVTLAESETVIDSLLSQIPQMFGESRETETVLGPVIQAGLDALKSAERSGKLYIFHTSLPIAEAPGKLKNRDDRKLLGTEKEKTILSPQSTFYTKLGQECVASGCSVDLFLFPNAYVDVASIGEVCRLTGGNMYKYSYFQADLDGERFLEDLRRNVENQTAFDAILRVRTSTGIRPVDFCGNFFMANTTDVELSAMDRDQAINVEIKHDDKLNEADGAYIQVAVLFTSVSGQRRLRIHNMAMNCCTQMADLFRNCELDALVNYMSKQAIKTSLNTNPRQVRENIINECAQILACYRKNCASPSSAGQLILPECMKLLPLYSSCVIKSDGLQGGSEISTDDRNYLMHLINSMDCRTSHVFFYPRLLPVHNLDIESKDMPSAIRCSVERLQENGVYLLENGISMFMWIGHNVDPQWIQDVFGVQSAAQVDIDKCKLLDLDNPVSNCLRGIINQVRKERNRYMKLTVVRQRDKLEPWFNHFLVEDKGLNNSASYVDYLCNIHKEIRSLLS